MYDYQACATAEQGAAVPSPGDGNRRTNPSALREMTAVRVVGGNAFQGHSSGPAPELPLASKRRYELETKALDLETLSFAY